MKEVWRFRALLLNFVVRELKLKYRGSLLGWLWALLAPALSLMVYAIVFGIFLRVEPRVAGNDTLRSFPLFLFCGLIVWNFFSSVVNRSMTWLIDAGPLLRKAYFPAEIPVVAGTIASIAQLVLETLVLVVVMTVLGNVAVTALLMLPLMICMVAVTLGISLILSLLNAYYRDVSHLTGIALTVVFYAIPLVYPIEIVPERIGEWFPARAIIRLNPLTQLVESSRDILYDLDVPSFERMLALLVSSSLILAVGWLVFRRYSHRLSEEL